MGSASFGKTILVCPTNIVGILSIVESTNMSRSRRLRAKYSWSTRWLSAENSLAVNSLSEVVRIVGHNFGRATLLSGILFAAVGVTEFSYGTVVSN